jgi:FRG domain
MKFLDTEVCSVTDLIERLQQTTSNDLTWFRGQPRSSWGLVPSLSRTPENLKKENELLKRFIQLAVPHLTENIPRGDWEWIFLMQHHRVPTRLLDWTESPLTALWFAVSGDSEDEKHDAAVWCLNPLLLNREARLRGRLETELPGFGKDGVLDSYLPDRQDTGAAQYPVAASGPRNSKRMAAQSGNFTISDAASSPIEEVGNKSHVWRFIVPKDSKPVIRKQLALLGFNELTLFPDLDRVASVTKELLR